MNCWFNEITFPSRFTKLRCGGTQIWKMDLHKLYFIWNRAPSTFKNYVDLYLSHLSVFKSQFCKSGRKSCISIPTIRIDLPNISIFTSCSKVMLWLREIPHIMTYDEVVEELKSLTPQIQHCSNCQETGHNITTCTAHCGNCGSYIHKANKCKSTVFTSDLVLHSTF